MRLIVYSAVPMPKAWAKNFCLDRFALEGYDVILIDASGIFNTTDQIAQYASGTSDYLYDGNTLSVFSLYELDDLIRGLNYQTDIIWVACRGVFNGTFNNDDVAIFHKYKIRYFTGFGYLTPQVKPNAIEYSTVRYFGKYLRYYASMYLLYIKNIPFKPLFVIGSGTAAREQAKVKISQMSDYVSLPSLNILWENPTIVKNKKYIVYVDEAADHSPDVHILGGVRPVKYPKKFHKSMNNLFSKISKWTGLPVIISASGKYYYKKNPFEGRKIVYGKTKGLVKSSQMVIGHKSSGLDQAIIDRKPILHILDKEFSDLKNRNINELSRIYFNQKAVWSHEVNESILNQIQQVDGSYLQQVEYDYFREEGLKGDFFSVLHNYLIQLN